MARAVFLRARALAGALENDRVAVRQIHTRVRIASKHALSSAFLPRWPGGLEEVLALGARRADLRVRRAARPLTMGAKSTRVR